MYSGLEGFCILLKRLAHPCRYANMVHRFGRGVPELCLIFNRVLDFVHFHHHHLLTSWDQHILQPQKMNDLHRVAWLNGQPLWLYGDPAYPLTGHLQAPFQNVPITQQMKNFNRAISEVRVAVC